MLTRMSSEKNRGEEKTFFYTNTFQSTTEKTSIRETGSSQSKVP